MSSSGALVPEEAIYKETGDIAKGYKPFEHPVVAGCFTVLKFLVLIGLYVGALVVIYGIINFQPPKGL